MLIRITKKSKPVEMTTQEFEDLVKKGKLTPESFIKNKFIADGKWVSIDNIEHFHRFSPICYPPGPHLVKKREIEEIRKNKMVEFDRLYQNYRSGEMIEKYFELTPVKKLYDSSDITMISRLTVRPSFEPEIVMTLLFGSGFLNVEIIRGSTSVWRTIPQPYSAISKNGDSLEKQMPYHLI